jgi:hypothetical protein
MAGNNEMRWLGLLLVVSLVCVAVPALADVTITATPNYTGVPIVICNLAINITGVSAVLVGNITHTGGDNATIRGFEWGLSTGNYTLSWNETGNFSVGVFYHEITGLSPEIEVFWRAFAVNSYGQGNSTECDFVTGSGLPLAPTNFTAIAVGTSSANLTWLMGLGANITIVRMSEDGYPQNVTDGILVYPGNETYAVVGGLNLDTTTYYFSAWSESDYGYSALHAEVSVGGTNMTLLIEIIFIIALCGFALWQRGWIRILLSICIVIWGVFITAQDIKIAAPLLVIGSVLFIQAIVVQIQGARENTK